MSAPIRSLLAQLHGEIRLLEAHDRNSTELIGKNVGENGRSFQGVWISGLTQTTYLGIPDTELVSPLKRATLMASIGNPQQESRRPLCAAFDADSGGDVADIPALVAVLAMNGVSMVIIEDKTVSEPGKKVNSLLTTSGSQGQADMHEFANVIRAFKSASAHREMMVTARIESFTVRIPKKDEAEEKASVQDSLRDALARAEVYTNAGADAIMIHSKSTLPDEVLFFLKAFRVEDPVTPLVVVPTAYSTTARAALIDAGANLIIYANHLMRAKLKAIGQISDQLLAEKPDLFSQDEELKACLEARNFGCLLRKLWERRSSGEEDEEAKWYRIIAEKHATENMDAAVRDLANGDLSGCEADERIISVKELLKINARKVSAV
ncbi:related to phosphoenolpyruvate phosphomutase [Phialocephala subalpina]|uniref:Related to phosphoenolpyruvate phosphomutase n=1 Tax=Phialocephala subalpina TaxID=576137 RepID=A0A1L7XMN8_9HELO|nr:related to phosphoenolpyruvate phosphomutase [Phialocephala subalpina]